MFMSETIKSNLEMTSKTPNIMNWPGSIAFLGSPHFQNMRKGRWLLVSCCSLLSPA